MPTYARILHCLDLANGHNKIYVARVDKLQAAGVGVTYRVVAAWGKATASNLTQQTKAESRDLGVAMASMDELASEKRRGGYIPIDSPHYNGGMTWTQCLAKIDTSRMMGGSNDSDTPPAPAPTPPKPSKKPSPTTVKSGGSARVNPSISL